MGTQCKSSYTIVLLVLLISCFICSCGDRKEQPKARVVSKKISIPSLSQPDPQKGPTKPGSVQDSVVTDDNRAMEESVVVAKRIYNPEERLNPFTPLFRTDTKDDQTSNAEQSKKKRRIPQTPLERIGLDQLTLVATVRASSGNRGLVEDSSGKGYIVKNGTYIGLNSGIVTQINANSMIVEEEIENLMGERILQNTEIKLQKSAGE